LDIKYLKNHQIDFKKWNWCISRSFNGIAYAYSWYLDIVSEGWEALIHGDYEIVMPITHFKKMGIKYLSQPLYTQQLGVFSLKQLSTEIVQEFIDSVPREFKLLNINLNKYNKIKHEKINIKENKTFELDLIKPYEKIHKNYSAETKNNIQKAEKNKVKIINSVSTNELIGLMRNGFGTKIKVQNEEYYNMIRQIISFGLKHSIGDLLGAYSANNSLCAAAFFITTNNKSIYLFAASSKEGIDNNAMFLLIDTFIKQFSERNLTLDFEGSNIDSLDKFYSGFNAQECKYLNIKMNRLPWILRIFKN